MGCIGDYLMEALTHENDEEEGQLCPGLRSIMFSLTLQSMDRVLAAMIESRMPTGGGAPQEVRIALPGEFKLVESGHT